MSKIKSFDNEITVKKSTIKVAFWVEKKQISLLFYFGWRKNKFQVNTVIRSKLCERCEEGNKIV